MRAWLSTQQQRLGGVEHQTGRSLVQRDQKHRHGVVAAGDLTRARANNSVVDRSHSGPSSMAVLRQARPAVGNRPCERQIRMFGYCLPMTGILAAVRISQYAYFSLSSETITAATITGRLGVEPDRILVRGTRDAARVLPRMHDWRVQARSENVPIGQLVGELVQRLDPVVEKIAVMVAEMPIDARLQLVRHFDDRKGVEDEGTMPETAAQGWEKLGGQHHLLGWHLDRQTLDFLERTHAELDVDEYG